MLKVKGWKNIDKKKYQQKGMNMFPLENVTFKEMLPRIERTLNLGGKKKEV